jgi:ABC-2 type transport system permease protein
MRKILAITRKDTLLRFSSVAEWLYFLILPIFFTVVLAGGTGGPQDPRVVLAVVDQAGTPLAADLLSVLEQSDAVRPELVTLDRAEDLFSGRERAAVLIIPAGFDMAHLEQGEAQLELRQLPNSMNALIAARAVAAAGQRTGSAAAIAASSVAEAERIQPFESDSARQAYFAAALEQAQAQMAQAPDRVAEAEGTTVEEIDYDPRANSSAGQLITWVFIPLIGIAALFAYERQKGTLRRLLTTPTPKATFLFGTIAGQVAMALVQMLLLVVFGIVVMKLNWGQSPAALALMLFASTLAAAALGTALGTLVKTEGQASGLATMLGMVMALLGGCWYPIELFPQFVRTAVKVLPTSWAMQGMLDIVLRGQGLAGVLPEALVLLGFAALFFFFGVWRFRWE